MKARDIISTHREGVSIIIDHSSNYRDLGRLLQTFTDNNNYHPVEIIIAASKHLQLLDEIIDQFKFNYFIMPLKCQSKSRTDLLNRAAADAVYPNLLLLDSAIIYTDNVLPLALSKLNNPLIGLVGIRLNEFESKDTHDERILQAGITVRWNKSTEQFEPIPVNLKHLPPDEYYKNRNYLAVSSSFLLCRKKDFLTIGGLNNRLNNGLAELEFSLRLQIELKKVCYCLNEKNLHINDSLMPEESVLDNNMKFDEIQYEKPSIDKYKIHRDTKNIFSSKIAIIAHVYYFEQWPDLVNLIKNIPVPFQLFVTMPENCTLDSQKAITEKFPDAKINLHPNRGRDIAPFLEVLSAIAENDFELVCKIHTKKDDPIYGDAWRRLMLDATLGSEDLVKLILEKFSKHTDLGMVGPSLLYKSGRSLMYENRSNIEKVRQYTSASTPLPADWGFFPGSCFWARPESLMPLAKAAKQLAYEDDNTKNDGQLAHAIERLFGLAILEAGQKIGLASKPPINNSEPNLEVITPPGNPSTEYVEQSILAYIRQNISGHQSQINSS